ncbi:MAG: hypothetical protein ICV87_04870 [Gemmatimonadetes bacterium]|nr:hypothetical protein [Gemmatimonadota bacterium]
MQFHPDIVAYSADGRLQMVGEIKSRQQGSSAAAVKVRHNLLAHGAFPRAPYFVVFFPEQLYLWKNGAGTTESPPDYTARITDILAEYLGTWSNNPENLAEESLSIALSAWFRDLAGDKRRVRSEADRVVVESGLSRAISRGEVNAEPRQ